MPPFHGGVDGSVVHSICVQLATVIPVHRNSNLICMFAARRMSAFVCFFFVDACVGPRSLKCYVFLAVMGATLEE